MARGGKRGVKGEDKLGKNVLKSRHDAALQKQKKAKRKTRTELS